MTPFNYQIVHRARRRSISISVKVDGTVRVLAPFNMPGEQVIAFIEQKSGWIQNKITHFKKIQCSHGLKEYITGERVTYLGRKYRLEIISAHASEQVKLKHGKFHVPLPEALSPEMQKQSVVEQLSSWYQQRARQILASKTDHFAKKMGLSPTLVGIKGYKRSWGSCHSDGRIYYNWRIIMAPTPIIDYLIIHELCHLIQPNHSKQFWHLVEKILPDYKEKRRWLKQNGFTLTV